MSHLSHDNLSHGSKVICVMHKGAIMGSFPHDIGILRSNTVLKRIKEERIKSKELVVCGGGYLGDAVGGRDRKGQQP